MKVGGMDFVLRINDENLRVFSGPTEENLRVFSSDTLSLILTNQTCFADKKGGV